MSMTIEGKSALINKLNKRQKDVKSDLEKALTKSALLVERDAKIDCPVDTGRLMNSITYNEQDYGTESPYVEIGTNVEYAPDVELGTSHQSAQPFLATAYENNKEEILKMIAQAVKDGAGL